MRTFLLLFTTILVCNVFAQEEINPIMGNPSLYGKYPVKNRTGQNSIDSTFIYTFGTLGIDDVWDDFSSDKFVNYPPQYSDPNVTDTLYYRLLNSADSIPFSSTTIFCDSTKAKHDTISIVSGIPTVFSSYVFSPHEVLVNDLTTYDLNGTVQNLYDECYVVVDSIIDGVPDPTQDTIWFTADPTYVQDSARVFTANMNDNSKIWVDHSACRNNRFAIDPWSLGVATFDGVDSTGMPYEFGNDNAYGAADYLTSKPINLLGKTNVKIQFIYQAQGHGNMPEPEDSLILEIWRPGDPLWKPLWESDIHPAPNQWDTVYATPPSTYMEDGFKFRIRNKASLSGALDHWHIDYVKVEENPLIEIQNFGDYAIAEPITSLLKDYTSVPWDHYRNLSAPNDEMIDTAIMKVYNCDVDATNFGATGTLEVNYDGGNQASIPLPVVASVPGWTGNWELGNSFYPIPWAAQHTFDAPGNDTMATFNLRLNARADLSGQSASNQHLENDTLYFDQVFKNYYAYDDGSAEVAYGITGSNSMLAYEFNAYEADTLTGVLMHFVPSVTDVSTYILLLTVWDDDNGQPGNILYQDDYFVPHYPEYGGAKNEFKYYEFVNPAFPSTIEVPEKFYVGWEQIESQSLNIGMDRNTDSGARIHFNTGGAWATSSQAGSLMIRPVFSTGINYTLGIEVEEINNREISVFPNPANERVNISGMNPTEKLCLFDLSGRLIQETYGSVLDVEALTTGLYIISVLNENEEIVFSEKLIKQ